MSKVFAEFSTLCPDCGELIAEGNQIYLIENIGWVHVRCPDTAQAIKREVCTECYTEKASNGACLCTR